MTRGLAPSQTRSSQPSMSTPLCRQARRTISPAALASSAASWWRKSMPSSPAMRDRLHLRRYLSGQARRATIALSNHLVSGGDILGRVGGEIADIWRLKIGPPTAIHRVVADPLDGARDVQRGRISADSPGGDGGGHERPGGFPGVRAAPGHGAQDAGLFSAAGLPAKEPTAPAQSFDKLRMRPSRAS